MPWNAARNGPNNDIKCFSHGCSLYDNTDPLSRPATSGPGKRCEAYFTADPRIGPAWRAKPSLRQLPLHTPYAIGAPGPVRPAPGSGAAYGATIGRRPSTRGSMSWSRGHGWQHDGRAGELLRRDSHSRCSRHSRGGGDGGRSLGHQRRAAARRAQQVGTTSLRGLGTQAAPNPPPLVNPIFGANITMHQVTGNSRPPLELGHPVQPATVAPRGAGLAVARVPAGLQPGGEHGWASIDNAAVPFATGGTFETQPGRALFSAGGRRQPHYALRAAHRPSTAALAESRAAHPTPRGVHDQHDWRGTGAMKTFWSHGGAASVIHGGQ